MRSPDFLKLLAKDWRELMASRAYWFLLLMIGPLVGQSFISAVALYAEASGTGEQPAALAQGLSPLDGILVPTFGAYDIAVTLLFPFVAIRLVAAEKESGALKLLLQLPNSLGAKITAKGLALLAGWFVAWIPGLIALLLWKSYGGHLYAPETWNLLLGHLLRMTLAGGVAILAAAVAESAASAAIITLGFTVGTWALDFIAAGRGGFLQELAVYTPTAALRVFEQGLLRFGMVIVIAALSLGAFAIAAIWLDTGRSLSYRAMASLVVTALIAATVYGGTLVRESLDTSEDRRNSFPPADEVALKKIREPLLVTVNLAPEDPRLTDLQRGILIKLQRILPRVEVDYVAASTTGLFEDAEDHYGEIWYEMNGRKVMERSTIVPIVLEQIYALAEINQPEPAEQSEYPGYPLAARPEKAKWIFYLFWPLATIAAWALIRYQRS